MTSTFETMGTVVSLRGSATAHAGAIEEVFRAFDERFSLYRQDSELSLIRRGELAMTASSAELRDAYEQAVDWRSRTNGAFSPHRPDGALDLSGIIKALALERSAELLDERGATNWSVNCGGDVIASGSDGPRAWTIGVVDPADRSTLLTAVALVEPRCAVATSGGAERGDHIWGLGTDGCVQVTVVANDIVTADVLATAIVAGGRESLDHVTEAFDVDVLAIARSGELLATPGFAGGMRAFGETIGASEREPE